MPKKVEKNFTILSNTCIAGFIYHKMGRQFLSPTINLWISQPHFVKFCLNINYYLSCKLIFFKHETRNCPCAKLGDIEVHFVHYSSEEEAERKWYERLKRIDFDSLYIITSDGNGVTDNELNQLDKVSAKRKIIFTSKKRNIKNQFVLYSLYKKDTAATHMTNVDIFNSPTVFREFNFKKWLAMRKHFRSVPSYFYFFIYKVYKFFKLLYRRKNE